MTPQNFNHFHHIAIIFQIFAVKTDGDLSQEEKVSIQTLLGEWIGDAGETMTVLKESSKFLAQYDEEHSDKITDLLTYSALAIKNAGIFKKSNLESIIADLEDIATSEGDEIDENKQAVIGFLKDIWEC